MVDIKSELDEITKQISNETFLSNKGIANEAGIHIFCYNPAYELVVRDYIFQILNRPSDVFHVIEKDLYVIFLEILQEKGVLDAVAALEENKGKTYLLAQLQKIADTNAFLDKMKYAPHKHGDVLFLTGIGKVYPFMRSHIMLNAMQEMFSDIPIVMFYPGEFDGQSLNLFAKFLDGHYYRAFNLLNNNNRRKM